MHLFEELNKISESRSLYTASSTVYGQVFIHVFNLACAFSSLQKQYFFPFHEVSICSLQSLNKIIQRDFFPELPKLRAQHEYLDAVEHNDVEKLREISARYQVTQTPGGRLGRNSPCTIVV